MSQGPQQRCAGYILEAVLEWYVVQVSQHIKKPLSLVLENLCDQPIRIHERRAGFQISDLQPQSAFMCPLHV
jgi:hypothetical protein